MKKQIDDILGGSRKTEVGRRKTEVGSPKPEPVFDSCKSNLLAPLSTLAKGDEIRPLVAGSEGVVTPTNAGKEKKEHRITNNEYRIRKAEAGNRNLTSNDTSTSFLSPSPFGEGRGEANIKSGSFLGNLVSDSLFPVERPGRLIIYFLFPEKGKRPETTPGWVKTTPELKKMTQGWVKIAPGIKKMTQGRVKTTPELRKMTQGRVKTTPGIRKMTHGRLKIAPGIKKMTHGRLKIASGIKKMTQGRVKIAPGMRKMTPGRVEYAPGPLPAPHGTIPPYTFTAAWYRVGRPERPEMGLIKGRNKEHRITNNEYRITNNESGSQKSEVRSSSEIPVSYFLFHISYFLFPGKGKENNEYRISNIEYRIRKAEDGIRNLTSNDTSTSFLSPSPFGEGRGEANIKSGSSSGTPVPYFLFLISYFLFPGKGKENNEYRIILAAAEGKVNLLAANPDGARSSVRVGTPEKPGTPVEYAPDVAFHGVNLEHETWNLQHGIRNQKTEQPSHTMSSSHSMTAKYKTLSRLPQESGFNSGDCPGAAAITIFYSFYSSPRVSPNFAGTTQKNLPVANQQAFHQGSIVPLFRGTSPGYPGRRGYLPFHRNLMFEALYQKGGTPMS
jgi:hypothetical protein